MLNSLFLQIVLLQDLNNKNLIQIFPISWKVLFLHSNFPSTEPNISLLYSQWGGEVKIENSMFVKETWKLFLSFWFPFALTYTHRHNTKYYMRH